MKLLMFKYMIKNELKKHQIVRVLARETSSVIKVKVVANNSIESSLAALTNDLFIEHPGFHLQ